MKKVAIIGTAGVPARYGGFETLAHHLVDQLQDRFQLSVYCSNRYYPKADRKRYFKGARLFHVPLNANGIQSILYDMVSILHALFYADTLIVLGVSGGMLIPLVKWFSRVKVIVNIDGLEWRRNKWSRPVRKFLKASEYLAVRYSDADISDNAAIKRYTAITYRTLSHLIAYGADHVSPQSLTKEDYQQYPFLRSPYAFKVCRIEPENNIHTVLKAFAATRTKQLVVVGNWNNSAYGRDLRARYASTPNLHLLDPIYDQQALDKLRSNCFVYVHGHSAGGTNPSLVEAMYLGLPVIAFNVPYNRATTEETALFFKDAQSLQSLLDSTSLEAYRKIGHQLRSIAYRRYTWEAIANQYANLVLGFDYAYRKKPVYPAMRSLGHAELTKRGLGHLSHAAKLFYE